MFSDTHFHFQKLCGGDVAFGAEILKTLAERDTAFGLDIGTEADDLPERERFAADCLAAIPDETARTKAERRLFFTAGIWPGPEAIFARDEQMRILKAAITSAERAAAVKNARVAAIGECGLDHHWNVADAHHPDFNPQLIAGERELFEMQLTLAKDLKLPIIIHSREAFEATMSCIKNVGYDSGVIHCYSYGVAEARAFVARGWYIALGGATTYAKKAEAAAMQEMIRSIPDERLLLETDAPFLAPKPFRGKKNTPLLIEHTYRFVAETRGTTPEHISEITDANIRALFAAASG